MDRYEERKEQSKENIRRAAEELFSKFGPDKVSVNDIALRAGVSQATVYNNFGTKDNLVHDYRRRIVGAVASRFREILVWKKSYVEKLQGFFQSWIDMADRYRIEEDNPARKQRHDPITSDLEELFQEVIDDGKEQGDIRTDVSDEAINAYIKFFRQGISNNPEIGKMMRRNSEMSNDLLSLFMHGISKPSAE